MQRTFGWLLVAMVLAFASGVALQVDACGGKTLLYGTEEQRREFVNELRSRGPAGLGHALREYDALKAALETPDLTPEQVNRLKEQLDRVANAVDQIGGAKYCSRSRLFWYTDLEQAKAAAQSSGKPILSLRMLGQLTDELSCANSRFFRTTLYANAEISELLRNDFVLHWKSVRPVPKVTIDFGDGRKLERTVTGNSIHYVLTPDGEVVDALPGLYGPKAFLRHLNELHRFTQETASLPAEQRGDALQTYHQRKFAELTTAWQAEWQAVQVPSAESAVAEPQDVVDDEIWTRIAQRHASDAALDQASVRLIQEQNPNAFVAGRRAMTKAIAENPLLRLVRNLQNSIASDTVRNEYQLHRQLHLWLARPNDLRDLDGLNSRVYTELFLTPDSDPWLGLVQPDVYTGIPNAGAVAAN